MSLTAQNPQSDGGTALLCRRFFDFSVNFDSMQSAALSQPEHAPCEG